MIGYFLCHSGVHTLDSFCSPTVQYKEKSVDNEPSAVLNSGLLLHHGIVFGSFEIAYYIVK